MRDTKPAKPPENKPVFLFAHLLFVAVAAGLVYSFVNVAREGETRRQCATTCLLLPDYAGADRRAPDFSLKDVNGKTVTLSEFRGKVVILNFWSTTCRPCLEEMPELAELAHILAPRNDVVMLTVTTDDDPQDVRNTLKSVLRDETPPFPVLFDPDNTIVSAKYGTHLVPETWLIDKHGVIRARFDGKRPWGDAAVVELVDELRNNGYCKIESKEGHLQGDGPRICSSVTGS